MKGHVTKKGSRWYFVLDVPNEEGKTKVVILEEKMKYRSLYKDHDLVNSTRYGTPN